MERRAPPLRDARVRLVTDERVAERPRLDAALPGRDRLDEVAAREREQRRPDVDRHERAHDVGVERLAADGCGFQDTALVGTQPVEARREQRVDRIRNRLPAVLERGRQQLLEEQRVPGRGVENRRPSIGRKRDIRSEAVDAAPLHRRPAERPAGSRTR